MAAASRVEDWHDRVTNLLECPVCSEFSTPPIHQCTNGHIICFGCLHKVTQCPICRIDMLPHRCLVADKLSEMCLVPCPNARVGCRSRQYHADVAEHADKCPFRLYKCELGSEDKCPWLGRRGTFRNHVLRFHRLKYSDGHIRIININEFDNATRRDWLDVSILFAFQEVFLCYLKVKVANEKMYGAVIYIGPEENAKDFLYKFEMRTENCSREITHRNATCADTLSLDSIIETGRCFVLDMATVNEFVVEDKLSVVVKVARGRSPSTNIYPTSEGNEKTCILQ